MGQVNQTCCSTRQRLPQNTLDKKEVFLLCDVLKHSQEENTTTLDIHCFERIFQDNPSFGQQVYEYCSHYLKLQPLPLEGCINILQSVLGSPQITQILLNISIENYDASPTTITAQQAYQFFGLITSIYLQFCIRKTTIEASVLEILINSIFSTSTMKSPDFLALVDATFPYANKLITQYLQNRLLQKPFNQMRIAKIDKDSFILKYEWLAILGMASAELHKHGQLTLLYQSALIGISYQEIFQHLQASQILLVTTFQDEHNRKLTIALYNKKQWTPDSKEQLASDATIAFQLYPTFSIIRPKPSTKNYFYENGFGFAKEGERFLIWLGIGQNYCLQSNRLLTVEIWRCEELQSKLRKSVLDEERVSNTSPRGEKKRVSFRVQENGAIQRKSASVIAAPINVFEQLDYQKITDEPSSPTSPHFKGAQQQQQQYLPQQQQQQQQLATFNNPKVELITQQVQLNKASNKTNRPSQSIIEKYSVQRQGRSTSNNQDIRKSVDDILKRYEKKK